MPRFAVNHRYQAGRLGPWDAGSEVELTADEAVHVEHDSPGALTALDPDEVPAGPTVEELRAAAEAGVNLDDGLDALSATKLKKLAHDEGIALAGAKAKAALVAVIRAARVAATPADDAPAGESTEGAMSTADSGLA